MNYTIGVVTYIKRFDKFFLPLAKELNRIFPDKQKIYILNGFYDKKMQWKYIQKVLSLKFLKNERVQIIPFEDNQSLAKCWNLSILMAPSEKILILNDDTLISPDFRYELEKKINKHDTFTINKSWSHFVISKNIVKKVGWFEERLPGVGLEDGDYLLRLAKYKNIKNVPENYILNINCLGLGNIVADNKDPGWKKKSSSVDNKYCSENYKFFKQKWVRSKKHIKGAIFHVGSYYKQKQNMQTPLFYPLDLLNYPKKYSTNNHFKYPWHRLLFYQIKKLFYRTVFKQDL